MQRIQNSNEAGTPQKLTVLMYHPQRPIYQIEPK